MKTIVFFLMIVFAASCTREVYVVRHAEKATPVDSMGKTMMDNDPPLSEAGKVRAIVLKDELSSKKIRSIYSTSTLRTFYTADPLSKEINVNIQAYRNIDSLVSIVKAGKRNSLIVGHSNTVDDLVNKLSGQTKYTDLKDHEYDNLFVVRFKRKTAVVERRKYGYPSNP